jgi:hypothetical protein
MTVPQTAFHAFAPTKSQLLYIREDLHPEVFGVVSEGFGGSTSTEARTWLRAYERFGDDFEEAAVAYSEDPSRIPGKLHPYISDPWKLTGYRHEEVSLATHYLAAVHTPPLLREHTGFSGLSFLMRTVTRHGMAPDELIKCAEWYSGGRTIAPDVRTYTHGWATLLFGTPAGTWSAADMKWLVEFDDKAAFTAAYTALTGIKSANTTSRAELPFSVLQAVLADDISPEYAREMLHHEA